MIKWENLSKFSKKRSVGIDPGMARCGLAISDPSASFALPMLTVILKKNDHRSAALQILQSLEKESIGTIVVGIPLLLSGKESRMTTWAREFYREICTCLGEQDIQVLQWDERLSSRQADVLLQESQIKKKRKKEVQDSVAATLILQSYLDVMNCQRKALSLRS